MLTEGNLADRYETESTRRSPILQRAENAAKVTIPHIMPPEGMSEGQQLKDPYQGLGARAVNTLTSKIMMALFPPNTPFFKLGFDQLTKAQFEQEGQQVDLTDAAKALSLYEQTASSKLEQTRIRATAAITLRHLVVTGNGMIRMSKEGTFQFYTLRHFVCKRDPEGNVMFAIVRENISPETLSEEVRDEVMTVAQLKKFEEDPSEPIQVYTAMTREDGKYKVWQEINGTKVAGSDGTYSLDAPLFIILRWTAIPGENYGRSMVDEYYGDFKALDSLAKDLLDASSAAAKVIFLRDPNSMISKRRLAEAKSGDILDGREEDIGTVGIDKMGDFQITLERMRDIRTEITEAFLMHSSIQRNAERVTAEEIRYMAQELEDALGGVYSVLAQEFQAPLIRRWLKIMNDQQVLPKLPDDEVELTITTGLEALGRGHETQRIVAMLNQSQQLLGPEFVAQRVDGEKLMKQLSTGHGVSNDDFIKDEKTVQQQQQQAMMQRAAEASAPGIAQEAVKQQGAKSDG